VIELLPVLLRNPSMRWEIAITVIRGANRKRTVLTGTYTKSRRSSEARYDKIEQPRYVALSVDAAFATAIS
jgi:hypothetical protein